MKTKLNDNEVKEIAEMQRKIDSYEAFIMAVGNAIMKPQVNFAIPLYEGISIEMEERLSCICEFIKKHIKSYGIQNIDTQRKQRGNTSKNKGCRN